MQALQWACFTFERIRRARNLTQERLAELVGIGAPNISYIETGKFAPSIETLQKIALALDVEPYVLYKFDMLVPLSQMRRELVAELEENESFLRLVYGFFLSVRFL